MLTPVLVVMARNKDLGIQKSAGQKSISRKAALMQSEDIWFMRMVFSKFTAVWDLWICSCQRVKKKTTGPVQSRKMHPDMGVMGTRSGLGRTGRYHPTFVYYIGFPPLSKRD